jgi:hypothetical protein
VKKEEVMQTVAPASGGHNTGTKELVVLFNGEGVVRKRTMRETTTTHKTGILGKT